MLEPAVMPRSCVYASTGDAACALVVHHRRERKTGPQIPVTVLQCRTHRRAFTLYPLGHVPYGRLAVAPVGFDGKVVLAADERPAWRTTLFESAFMAVCEPAVKVTDARWWATESRDLLGYCATLLGVHPALPTQDADAIAFRLELPRLELRQATDAYARGRGRAHRGRVLVGVLDRLGDACLLDRVLAAGARAGGWGTVMRWDAASRGAAGRVFPGRGAPAG